MRISVQLSRVAICGLGLLFTGCYSSSTINSNLLSSPTGIQLSRWSPDHVWVPAHYEFKEGKYVWIKGQYEYQPRYKTRWTPAHIRKTPRGKIWIEDRWQ